MRHSPAGLPSVLFMDYCGRRNSTRSRRRVEYTANNTRHPKKNTSYHAGAYSALDFMLFLTLCASGIETLLLSLSFFSYFIDSSREPTGTLSHRVCRDVSTGVSRYARSIGQSDSNRASVGPKGWQPLNFSI